MKRRPEGLPILLSGPMVRASWEGRKTQTRRLLTPHNFRLFAPDRGLFKPTAQLLDRAFLKASDMRWLGGGSFAWRAKAFDYQTGDVTHWQGATLIEPGDLLWVREAWRTHRDHDGIAPRDLLDGKRCVVVSFSADNDGDDWLGRARPSIFLPRWASRLTLEVSAVKIERLQDISEQDARRECLKSTRLGGVTGNPWHTIYGLSRDCVSAVQGFRELWNMIHGKRAWDANPWVVAITFTVHKINIDALLAARAREAEGEAA